VKPAGLSERIDIARSRRAAPRDFSINRGFLAYTKLRTSRED
jgi:hypothetical protein